ncbi:MAG: Ig-like domain-containing protein, partial [Desulfobacterales bacterium]|nr:Ig-like domain-containing protein [Desulfobacterales bacterium]
MRRISSFVSSIFLVALLSAITISLGNVSDAFSATDIAINQSIPNTYVIKGDLDQGGSVDLADAILALQTTSNLSPVATIHKEASVSKVKIGVDDVIYILQIIAGIRTNLNQLIVVTPVDPTIPIGLMQQFTATGTYSDGTTRDLTTSVTWSSSNTGTATVSNIPGSNGLATSVAAGSTTITATSESLSGSTTLTVGIAQGKDWTLRGTDARLSSIAWSGTQFVAILNGNVYNSPDGITWHPVDGAYAAQADIVWSGTQFVAVGGMAVSTSPDGLVWTSKDVSPTSLAAIAWSGAQFVAVGSGGGIVTSPDGVTWTSRISGASGQWLSDVVWTGTQFLVVGDAEVLTSSDGAAWTVVATTGYPGSLYSAPSIAYSGTQFVLVNLDGVITTSPDGVTWTSRILGVPWLRDIVWSGTQFVAVGGGGVIFTSPDGITWSSQTPVATSNLGKVIWTGTQFLAVGYG